MNGQPVFGAVVRAAPDFGGHGALGDAPVKGVAGLVTQRSAADGSFSIEVRAGEPS
jgi:hypothetical protein